MFRRIGFVLKTRHLKSVSLAQDLISIAHRLKRTVWMDEEASSFLNRDGVHFAPKEKMTKNIDLMVVLGGDGTFLSAARPLARNFKKNSAPILGINLGTLGFLTEISPLEAPRIFEKLLKNKTKPVTQKRNLLEVIIRREGKTVFSSPFLNDIVISNQQIARIISVRVQIGKRVINQIRADGLILSTPTGSTAYCLAAGVPIVDPDLSAMILAPICPHSLTQRPLVISENKDIQFSLTSSHASAVVTVDGQEAYPIVGTDEVLVRPYKKGAIQIIQGSRDYYQVLREKLSFGNSELVSL